MYCGFTEKCNKDIKYYILVLYTIYVGIIKYKLLYTSLSVMSCKI